MVKDRWYHLGEALAITAGLIAAAGAIWATPSGIFPVPGLQFVVAIAIGGLAMRICISAGWALGVTFAHPRTGALISIATSLVYTTMVGALVIGLVKRSPIGG